MSIVFHFVLFLVLQAKINAKQLSWAVTMVYYFENRVTNYVGYLAKV